MGVKIRFRCPHCSRSIEHNPAYAGMVVLCGACKGEFYEPTDPLPGRAADKVPDNRPATEATLIARAPIGYTPPPGKESEKSPVSPPATAPAAGAGPRIRDPKATGGKERPGTAAAPAGGSLWSQALVETPPTTSEKSAPSRSAPGVPARLPSVPPTTKDRTKMSDDELDDVEFEETFLSALETEPTKPRTPPGPPTAKPRTEPSKSSAPLARPVGSPPPSPVKSPPPGMPAPKLPLATVGTPSAGAMRPPAPPQPATLKPQPRLTGAVDLSSASANDMVEELRRRGNFAALVYGDPAQPDSMRLSFSENMTQEDAVAFLAKLVARDKKADEGDGGSKPGLLGRLFGRSS